MDQWDRMVSLCGSGPGSFRLQKSHVQRAQDLPSAILSGHVTLQKARSVNPLQGGELPAEPLAAQATELGQALCTAESMPSALPPEVRYRTVCRLPLGPFQALPRNWHKGRSKDSQPTRCQTRGPYETNRLQHSSGVLRPCCLPPRFPRISNKHAQGEVFLAASTRGPTSQRPGSGALVASTAAGQRLLPAPRSSA